MDKKLRLSRKNKYIAGVCGGVAEYFNIDVSIVRVLFVILFFFTSRLLFLALYIILWAVLPQAAD